MLEAQAVPEDWLAFSAEALEALEVQAVLLTSSAVLVLEAMQQLELLESEPRGPL